MGKALVPFAFVFSPALLSIDFTWAGFAMALASTVLAILALGAAYVGYVRPPVGRLAFAVR